MKKIILRILAAVTAFSLIGVLCWFAVSFLGDPISGLLATRDIRRYVEDTYGEEGLALKTEFAGYNFKSGSYVSQVQSALSPDTRFSVVWRRGTILYDTYDTDVADGWITRYRVTNEATQEILDRIKAMPLACSGYVTLPEGEAGAAIRIPADTPYDKSLGLPLELVLFTENTVQTLPQAADLLSRLHAFLGNEGYRITRYSLQDRSEGQHLSVGEITAADIEGGDLLSLLQEAKRRCDAEEAGDKNETKPDDAPYLPLMYAAIWTTD